MPRHSGQDTASNRLQFTFVFRQSASLRATFSVRTLRPEPLGAFLADLRLEARIVRVVEARRGQDDAGWTVNLPRLAAAIRTRRNRLSWTLLDFAGVVADVADDVV